MSSSIVIANFSTGFETDREPFLINNDAFPVLQDFYVWRGRILRKRGTTQLGRLQNNLTAESLGNTDGAGLFSGNIITILTLNGAASIVPGSITVHVGAQDFTEPSPPDGTLSNGTGGSGTINYATGALTIVTDPVLITTAVTIDVSYYPNLPVMGIEDFQTGRINFPTTVFFNTEFSYQYDGATNTFYNVNFYLGTHIPFLWSGQDYQQFWSTNYEGAMWVTNNNPGLNFVTATYTSGSTTADITFNFKSGGVNFTTLVIGDILWFNEWSGSSINGLSGTVSDITGAAMGNYIVHFAATVTVAGTGIAQLMTNTIPGQDGIKWYDGDPIADPTKGWVNFAPPLQNTLNPQYLVGAKIIVPFKNRLLFFGCWLATSTTAAVYNNNMLVYSQVGTAYYSLPVPPNQTADPAAYFQNVAGRGGFINAPIAQEIVTVVDNEDVLLTGYETKQLKLIFTNDDSLPFIYQTINSEFGSQNTFSGIALDIGAVTIGDYGIAMTTQISSQRIDLKILDRVFDISTTNNDDKRVCAVRDFRNELIYFTYTPDTSEWTYPTQTLVYNYRDNTWSQFEERYTTYGNFRFSTSFTWATLPYDTWSDWVNPWNFGNLGARYPSIAGGNVQGFVMLKSDEGTTQSDSQYISNIVSGGGTTTITSPNHCLTPDNYIEISGVIGSGTMTSINNIIFRILSVPSTSTFTIDSLEGVTGTYDGNGEYRILSQPFLQSKQFPVSWPNLKKTRFGTQMFMFETTATGQVEVTIYANQNSSIATNNPVSSNYIVFSDIVNTCPEPMPVQIKNYAFGNIGDGINMSYDIDLLAIVPILNRGIVPGSVNIIIGSPGTSTFVDDTDGNFITTGFGSSLLSTIDYTSGDCTLVFTQAIAASTITVSFAYYPQANYTENSDQLWHRLSNSFIGDTLQFGVTLNDAQMRDNNINSEEIILHAVAVPVYPGPVLGFYL